jgi:hypothetical protein
VTAAATPEAKLWRRAGHSRDISPHLNSFSGAKGLILVGLFAQRHFEQLSLTIFKCVTAI